MVFWKLGCALAVCGSLVGEESMVIAVGSTNVAKVNAVREAMMESPRFTSTEIVSVETSSDVSSQPMTLQETIQGAKNRAKNAFERCEGCSYSVGIEGGLMETDEAATGYLHISACSIYDGKHHYIGLSTGFEIPPLILELILDKKMDLSQACLKAGISQNTNIGSTEGLIGVLSKGRMNRKTYSKECVLTALLQLENAEWYRR